MTALASWRDGARRVNRAPALLAGLWLLTTLVTAPLALSVRGGIAAQLGSSLEADGAARGVNYDWMLELEEQSSGLAVTVSPTILGFAAVLDNLSRFLDAGARPLLITGAALGYGVLLLFLAGGILDRYARDRELAPHAFFGACGSYFFRFLRLSVVSSAAYVALFRWYHPWLFNSVYLALTRDVTAERTAFLTRIALYVMFVMPLAFFNLVFDYAKVRAVVEDRRSILVSLGAAIRFFFRNAGSAIALYLLDAAVFLLAIAAYAIVAPGAGGAGWSMWLAFAVGQLYVIARLWVKLLFWASEIAFFQGRLAHAGYVSRRAPAWPDSPAAEALRSPL